MMTNCMKFTIRLILTIFLILNVSSQKTGSDLRRSEDEPRRQDSNQEIVKSMHLCIEEEDQTERLITCDRRYSSKFACVGSWEGALRMCDKFGEYTLAAPICVQANSSYVVICQYKNFKLSGLCSPKKPWKNDKSEFHKYVKFTEGLRENIRACKKSDQRMKRICLNKGILIHCDENSQEAFINTSSEIPDKSRNKPTITLTKANTLSRQRDNPEFLNQKKSLAVLKYTRNKTESVYNSMKSRFQSTKQKKPYRISVISKNNPTFKYNLAKKWHSQRGIFGFSNRNNFLSAITPVANKREPTPTVIESAPEATEITLSQTKFSIDKALNRFVTYKKLTTAKFDQQLKMHVPSTRESQMSREEFVIDQLKTIHGDSATDKPQRKLKNSEVRPKMRGPPGDSDKRSMETEYISENSRTPKLPELLYRAPEKPRSRPPSTRILGNTKGQNMFFHVLKCKDCNIQHDMVVEKKAEDVLPEVETWTFKT